VKVGLKFKMTFLTQHLGLFIFYPNLGLFKVHISAKFKTMLLIFMLFLSVTLQIDNSSDFHNISCQNIKCVEKEL